MSKIGQVHPYSRSIERTASVGRGASAPHHLEFPQSRFLTRWRACLRGRYPPSQPIKNKSTVTAKSRQAISQRDREFAAALWFERRH